VQHNNNKQDSDKTISARQDKAISRLLQDTRQSKNNQMIITRLSQDKTRQSQDKAQSQDKTIARHDKTLSRQDKTSWSWPLGIGLLVSENKRRDQTRPDQTRPDKTRQDKAKQEITRIEIEKGGTRHDEGKERERPALFCVFPVSSG
jgi:hypothetical protein